ncbi:hypothetical protein MIND_00635200 [Mycena indigotica]|uniref:F-box domain-containing protein n=1 Tax=Mycena indigotica TaxID=2126181 RepID=A0A8H6SRF1_9AGAR|nr:uncharacterized protein MIND_00635200 [Mycena indigotica]KAF7304039.1 hypothetical protein MIND_00635200 [Mycena indigotica]
MTHRRSRSHPRFLFPCAMTDILQNPARPPRSVVTLPLPLPPPSVERQMPAPCPIILLPPEVLGEIFMLCLPTTHNAVLSGDAAPLLLGRVCGTWRATAWALPALWTSLHVAVEHVRTRRGADTAVEDWLRRARQLPLALSVVYDADARAGQQSREINKSFIAWLLRLCAGGLAMLQIVEPKTGAPLLANTPGLELIGNLRVLRLKSGTIRWPPLAHYTDLWGLPHVTALALDLQRESSRGERDFGPQLLNLPLRWGQLTCLALRDEVQLSVIAALLRRMPQLRRLVFHRDFFEAAGAVPWPDERLTHTALEALIVLGWKRTSGRDVADFFNDAVSLPNLRRLRLSATQTDDIMLPAGIGALFPRLARLSLAADSFSPDALRAALADADLRTLVALVIRYDLGPWRWTMPRLLALLAVPGRMPLLADLWLDATSLPGDVAPLLARILSARAGVLRAIHVRQTVGMLTEEWDLWAAAGPGLSPGVELHEVWTEDEPLLFGPLGQYRSGSPEEEPDASPWDGLKEVGMEWMHV